MYIYMYMYMYIVISLLFNSSPSSGRQTNRTVTVVMAVDTLETVDMEEVIAVEVPMEVVEVAVVEEEVDFLEDTAVLLWEAAAGFQMDISEEVFSRLISRKPS